MIASLSEKRNLKKVSNPDLYKFRAEETIVEREQRLLMVQKDQDDRFAEINKFLGRKAPANVMEPDARYGINPALNKMETIKQLLYINGVKTPEDYEDMYNIVADYSITVTDDDKEKILATTQAAKLVRGGGSGIIVPGKN